MTNVNTPVSSASGTRQNLPTLTGARWWAASIVFFVHVLLFLPVYPFQTTQLFKDLNTWVPMPLGSIGVTFFFVLSGFIIYWSNWRMPSVKNYMKRRAIKIYPTHLITAVLFIAAAAVPLSRLELWLPNFLLIHTWVPDWTRLGGLNVPAWSLVAEVLFYFTFPLFLPLVTKLKGKFIWVAMAGLFATIVAAHTVFMFATNAVDTVGISFMPHIDPNATVSPYAVKYADSSWFSAEEIPVYWPFWLSYSFPLTRLLEFYMGVLAAKLVMDGLWRYGKLFWPSVALAISYAGTYLVPINYKLSVLTLVPTTLLIAAMAVKDINGKTGISGHKVVVWLGNVSFAFYLVQFPVMVFLSKYFIGGNSYGLVGWLGWIAVTFVITLAISAFIFEVIDDPLMRSRWAKGRKKTSATGQ